MSSTEGRKQERKASRQGHNMPSTTASQPLSNLQAANKNRPNMKAFDKNEAARNCPYGDVRSYQEGNGWFIDPLTDEGYYAKG